MIPLPIIRPTRNRRRRKPLPALWTYSVAILLSASLVLAAVWLNLYLQNL
jgi:hypothetical protein